MNRVIVCGFLLVLCLLVCDGERKVKPYRKNWALRKPAINSILSKTHPALLAVNGDRSNDFNHGSCSQTKVCKDPWWQVDLLQYVLVDTVFIVNRGDCCGTELSYFVLYVWHNFENTICYRNNDTMKTGEARLFPCAIPLVGTHVALVAYSAKARLTLCEVEVYGTEVPDVNRLILNWAQGKPTYQSSTFQRGESKHAVDGNTDGNFYHGSCASTNTGDKHPWWMVNLRAVLWIVHVVTYNRVDGYAKRFHNIYVNTLKTRDVAMPELCGVAYMDINEKHDFHCAKPLQGAWVKIWKDKFGESHDVMTLCEVKVIGTRTEVLTPGFYQRRDNYANGKKSVMSGHDGEMKNANDGDIYIYQNSMSCVNVVPKNSGLWLRIKTGHMFIDAVVVMIDAECCSEKYSLQLWVTEKVQCKVNSAANVVHYIINFDCPANTYGHSATLSKHPAHGHLPVCEMQVFGYDNDQNWALGRLATIEEKLPGGSIRRHKLPSATDGDISNGYQIRSCPSFFTKKYPARLVVDLREVYVSVDVVFYTTPNGPKAHIVVRYPVITVKNSTEDKSVNCMPKSRIFKPGILVEVMCVGVVGNMIILTNGPNEKELAICEVEVYGFFFAIKPVKPPSWVERFFLSL